MAEPEGNVKHCDINTRKPRRLATLGLSLAGTFQSASLLIRAVLCRCRQCDLILHRSLTTAPAQGRSEFRAFSPRPKGLGLIRPFLGGVDPWAVGGVEVRSLAQSRQNPGCAFPYRPADKLPRRAVNVVGWTRRALGGHCLDRPDTGVLPRHRQTLRAYGLPVIRRSLAVRRRRRMS